MAIAACVRQIGTKPMQASGRIGLRHEATLMAQTLRAHNPPTATAELLTRSAAAKSQGVAHASYNAERSGLAVLAGSAAGACRRRVPGRCDHEIIDELEAINKSTAEFTRTSDKVIEGIETEDQETEAKRQLVEQLQQLLGHTLNAGDLVFNTPADAPPFVTSVEVNIMEEKKTVLSAACPNKKAAEQSAARAMVEKLQKDFSQEFKKQPICGPMVPVFCCTVSILLGDLMICEAASFVVELLWLPETYHYQAAALADLPQSAPLIQDLVLLGGVRTSAEPVEAIRERFRAKVVM
eukprot:g32632.t1